MLNKQGERVWIRRGGGFSAMAGSLRNVLGENDAPGSLDKY